MPGTKSTKWASSPSLCPPPGRSHYVAKANQYTGHCVLIRSTEPNLSGQGSFMNEIILKKVEQVKGEKEKGIPDRKRGSSQVPRRITLSFWYQKAKREAGKQGWRE